MGESVRTRCPPNSRGGQLRRVTDLDFTRQHFPDDRKQIVRAEVVKVGTEFRIEIASATIT